MKALLLVWGLAWATAERPASAATIWNGPLVTFTKPPTGGSGNNPTNQDRLTADVWLTRNQTEGLFNAALESGYTHYFSPANTEWAYGSLANYDSLHYAPWETWNASNPPSMVGRPAVLHLVSDDIYLSVEFLSWGAKSGGFSYERSVAVVPEPATGGLFLVGLALFACVRALRLRRTTKNTG